jgi:hypothetical protein
MCVVLFRMGVTVFPFLSHPDGGAFAPWFVGGVGVLPVPSWGVGSISPYPVLWCWLFSGVGEFLLSLSYPIRVACFSPVGDMYGPWCVGEKRFSPAYLHGMGKECFPYPDVLLDLNGVPRGW